jgi:ribose transport system substrate-binding protein
MWPKPYPALPLARLLTSILRMAAHGRGRLSRTFLKMQLTTKFHSTLLLLALVGASVSLSACGGEGGSGSAAPSGGGNQPSTANPGDRPSGYKIGCTIPTFNHPFFVAMKEGLEEQAKEAGSAINVVDGNNDANTQVSAIDDFIVQKVDAIILCPTETKSLIAAVEKAHKAGIPVITVNRLVDSPDVVTYVGADDKEGGKMQGQALMELLPKGANIVLLQGVIGSSPQRDRQAGLEEALKGKPSYKIVSEQPYKFERTEGIKVMDTVLTQMAKGKIDAVVAQSDDGALAAADVCAQKGRTEIKIIGFNGESDTFDRIKEGKIHATILQDAKTQGIESVKATLKHLKGEKVENPQITPLYIVKKDNINKYTPAWQSTKS